MPSGAFRGYGLSQTNFAIELAMDELARMIGMDPFAFRRLNVVRPGDSLAGDGHGPHDVEFGSYGLDQCLDLVEARFDDEPRRSLGDDWLIGRGVAAGMIDTIPPRGHHADCRIRLAEDGRYELFVGTCEFGNGTTTVHGQIAASVLATTVESVRIHQSDTDLVAHDFGRLRKHRHGRGGVGDPGGCGGARRGDPRFRGRSVWRGSRRLPVGRRSCRRRRAPHHARGARRRRARRGRAARGRGPFRRDAPFGRVQRARLRSRRASALWRDSHPQKHSRRGRGRRRQSDAMPRTGRGRRRPGDRGRAV